MEWILAYRTPELTALFRGLTFLGDPTFFLLLIPLGYWLWRSDLFFRFGVLLLVSNLINIALKATFQVPRPDVLHLTEASGWSFPSGHAQTAATVWPWLVLALGKSRSPAAWTAASLLVLGVAASRVYLGVHTPGDVIAGVAVGLGIALAAWRIERRPPRRWTGLDVHLQVGAGLAIVTAWVLVLGLGADGLLPATAGGLLGLWAGGLYQHRLVDMNPVSGWSKILAASGLGLAVIFALRIGLAALFSEAGVPEGPADVARYFAITLWISLLAPWLFVTLSLASSRRASGAPT